MGTTIGLAVALLAPAAAFADRNFTPRFSENVPGGDIAIAANTLMTCSAADPDCAAAQDGTATGGAANNNNHDMEYVDVDADPSTFSSSSATLDLPPGARVLFAGLYYGGRTSAGTGGSPAPNADARGMVRFRPPGAPSYEALSGAVDDSDSVSAAYQGFVDVTQQVAVAGPGAYTVADVQAGTGQDRYSGWALVVAYRDDVPPPRNLTVFDGLRSVSQAQPAVTMNPSGFETPETGEVNTRMGFVVYEGDRGSSGDRALLNGRELSDAANPATNYFNSSISLNGADVTTKDPNFVNQLGFDAIVSSVDGFLDNGETGATIELFTTFEQYLPGVVTFATELDPAVLADVEVEDDCDNRSAIGRELDCTITVTNNGDGPAEDVELVDRKSSRVRVLEASPSTGECTRTDVTRRVIRCSLGTLEAGEQATVELALRPLRRGELSDTVTVSAFGEEAASDTEVTRVRRGRARLRIRKRASRKRVRAGRKVRFRIVLRARGRASVVRGRVCDRLPRALTIARAPRAQVRDGRACWKIRRLDPGERKVKRLVARASNVPATRRVRNKARVNASNLKRKRARVGVRIDPKPAPPGGVTG